MGVDKNPEADSSAKRTLFFGVSGHRDLVPSDRAELAKHLDTVFGHFSAAYPGFEFQLLTPLAEGADRLAAGVAMARGIRVAVPMPMPEAEYERDFQTAESLDEFRRLLAKAGTHWVVSPQPQSGRRAEYYAAVGDYIARHSNVLILLWDGIQNEKLGGTGWVKVRRDYWMARASQDASTVPPPGYLDTVQIVTPRLASEPKPTIGIHGTFTGTKA